MAGLANTPPWRGFEQKDSTSVLPMAPFLCLVVAPAINEWIPATAKLTTWQSMGPGYER
jgi:hypothetical protein